MAERKLNFNAPLLSTRRMHKTAVSMRRNKKHNFTDDSKTNDCSPVPVLVPVMCLDQVTEAASVPFTWEQASGRLKDNDFRPQVCVSTQEEEEKEEEEKEEEEKEEEEKEVCTPGKVMDILKCPIEKSINGNLSSKGTEVEESEDGGHDVFSDARDTLSANDSFSINHSIGGVSGFGVVETKKSLSDDTQSLDFMLNRFLPAAKAMTVEQPHYASNRKPSTFMFEPTIQKRDLVPEEKRKPPNGYDESMASLHYYHQDIDDEKSEEDNEDDEDSKYTYLLKRGCGILPQLCFKDSLGMLNTVRGFKSKHNPPVTSPSDDQVKSSKVALLKSRFQSAKKLALNSISKQKLGGEVQSLVHPSVRKKSNSESNLTSAASRSSSPYKHARCMSPFHSTGNSSSFHPAGFLETRKETENLRANRLNKHIRNISKSHELLYRKSNGSTSSLLENTDTKKFPMTMIVSDANPDLEASETINITMVKGDELGKIKSGPDQFPLAPPSHKKPSESWLLHNMPPVTSQISSRRCQLNPEKQDITENSRNVTKWENIVKTSYMHRDHIRYSEEMVAHTSHQSKT